MAGALSAAKVRHTFFPMAGRHHYVVWHRCFEETAPLLFRRVRHGVWSATCALANSHAQADGHTPSLLPMSSPISRRTALRAIAGATALASLSRSRAADAATKSTPATPTTSSPLRQSACK